MVRIHDRPCPRRFGGLADVRVLEVVDLEPAQLQALRGAQLAAHLSLRSEPNVYVHVRLAYERAGMDVHVKGRAANLGCQPGFLGELAPRYSGGVRLAVTVPAGL